MTYDEIADVLILGRRFAREGWEAEGIWIQRRPPHPFPCKMPADGDPVPYIPTWDDLLADDWMVVF